MKIKILLLSLLLSLFNSCILQNNEKFVINRIDDYNNSIIDKNGWLIMIYMSGSGNLEEESITDINNIKEGYYNNNSDIQNDIDIVVLHDRGPGYSTSENDWTGTYLYKCEAEGLIPISNAEGWRESVNQEENMGSKETLDHFISWSKDNYHRTKESLIIWNHGGGLSGQVLEKNRAVSWDIENTDSKENDALYINEIQEILSNHYNNNSKLDILGFDACYMGMVEIVYEFRDFVDYIVASPGVETGGWRYNDFLPNIEEESTSIEICNYIVSTYEDFSTNNNLNNSLSALDLSYIKPLKTYIEELSSKIITLEYEDFIGIRNTVYTYYDSTIPNENILYPYVDFKETFESFNNIQELEAESQNILEILNNLILCTFKTTKSNGLSIFFSNSRESYSYQTWYTGVESTTFGGVDFCKDGYENTNWKSVMDNFFLEGSNL